MTRQSNWRQDASVLSMSLVVALAVLGCSMSEFKPGSDAASAGLTEFVAPTTPTGYVPKADAVPIAVSALGYTDSSMDGLISHYARHYSVPEDLLRQVIVRKSNYNAGARN